MQSSVLRFMGLVERSAEGLEERSLRSDDGRTADTAELGGWTDYWQRDVLSK